MSPEMLWLATFAGVVIVGILVFLISKGTISPEELATAAHMAVMAAEQYRSDGKLTTNDEQLEFAITFMKKLIPWSKRVPDSVFLGAIHAWVPTANMITQSLEAGTAAKPPATVTVPGSTLGTPKPRVDLTGLR